MKKIRSLEDLNRFREEVIDEDKHKAEAGNIQVIVSLGTCGIAAGALDTLQAVQQQMEANKLKDISISQIGCVGLCRHEPIINVAIGESAGVTYGSVTPETVERIFREHIIGGKVVDEFVIESIPFPTI